MRKRFTTGVKEDPHDIAPMMGISASEAERSLKANLSENAPAPESGESTEKSETSVREGFRTEGNGFVHRQRNEQNPDFSAKRPYFPLYRL